MLKKILKGFGIFLLLSIITLAAVPFLFKDKIKELVVKAINDKVDAKVAEEVYVNVEIEGATKVYAKESNREYKVCF